MASVERATHDDPLQAVYYPLLPTSSKKLFRANDLVPLIHSPIIYSVVCITFSTICG
jgi:hypothetical protein